MDETEIPIKMLVYVEGLHSQAARTLAYEALRRCREVMPKLWSTKKRIWATWGDGFYGLTWGDSYLWFQEQGIRAFTMNSLQGKTIPMWVDDNDGELQRKNSKIQVKIGSDSRIKVLIFRKATKPGAPGRISRREARKPFTRPGKLGGQIAPGNVGVKWRHPGLRGTHYLLYGLTETARVHGVSIKDIVSIDRSGHPSPVIY